MKYKKERKLVKIIWNNGSGCKEGNIDLSIECTLMSSDVYRLFDAPLQISGMS